MANRISAELITLIMELFPDNWSSLPIEKKQQTWNRIQELEIYNYQSGVEYGRGEVLDKLSDFIREEKTSQQYLQQKVTAGENHD